ncbi:hypothetical protein QR680_001385 [Steinernema hermaphroditum]|uniref:Nuclear pore complex protein Nup85 n=1 Tax=Steinernema hermaphroditum TaxID=289476 RepID=A0AA39GY19_9BILA|nr:hypothetical protein QR680_001385 [Steinernema hermaphroditum]
MEVNSVTHCIRPQQNNKTHSNGEDGNWVLHLANKKRVVRSEQLRMKHAALLSNSAYMKLVNESHSVFSRLQRAVTTHLKQNDAEFLNSLDQASREYRAVLRSAIVTVMHSSSEQDRRLLLCLRGREMLWGLIELVAFCDREEEIAFHLSKWARMMLLSEASDVYAQIVNTGAGSRSSERNELYWNGVILQVLSCNFNTATTLLHSHSDAQSDRAVGKMVIMLERLNRLFTEGYSCTQFIKIQETLRSLLRENYFSQNSNITFIARLLSGDIDAYEEVCADLIDYWCEIVPLFTITQVANATLNDLHVCAQKCFNFNSARNNRQLDLTLMTAMSGDVMEALLGAANCFGDWWFSAHLSDLIFRAKPTVLYEDNANLRDVFLLEYAHILLADEQLWRPAVDYLTDISNGFELLEDFILSQSVNTTKKALQLLSICNKWDFREGRRAVTKKMAEVSLDKLEFANALVWAHKSDESSMVSKVVNQILRRSPNDILTIGKYVKLSHEWSFSCPELVFLSDYYEFLILAQSAKPHDSLKKLTGILTNKRVPPFMYSQLLECVIKCIEELDAKISDYVHVILGCLQKLRLEMVRSHSRVERYSDVEKKLEIINNVLAKHLLHKNLFGNKL